MQISCVKWLTGRLGKPKNIYLLLFICIYIFLFPTNSYSQEMSQKPLKVATYSCPPFVYINNEGEYSGLGFKLWERIADRLKLDYYVDNYVLADLLDAIEDGDVDVGVSCITITSERAKTIDFSHSFYETHLAIVVKKSGYLSAFMKMVNNEKTIKIMIGLFFVAIFIGTVFYFLERSVNEQLYLKTSPLGKMIEITILGLVFITKGPLSYLTFNSLAARVISVALMMASTLFITSLTAILASTFAISVINADIQGPNDLYNSRIGVKQDTTAARYLDDMQVSYNEYDTLAEMLNALERDEIDAAVNDEGILKYEIKAAQKKGLYQDILVLPYAFEKQNYGIVLSENNKYKEDINQELLEMRESREWGLMLNDYFTIN